MTKVTIGPCTLIHADSRDIASEISVDCVFTSPPYNCGIDYGVYKDSIPVDEYKKFLFDTIYQVNSRVYIINVGQYIGSRDSRVRFRGLLENIFGEESIDEVIWDKGPANGAAWGNYPNSPRIRAQHESIFVFGNATMPNGNGLDWREWSRLTTSVWRVPAKVDLKVHPAMMPIDVAVRAISLWADTEGVVYDPFMGSGTTALACLKAGRRFIGCEVDNAHFDTAVTRVTEAYSQLELAL